MKRLTCLFFNFAGIAIAAAQDDTKNSTTNLSPKGDSNWYASPWLWVIAAAVFILLLVALTRGGKSKD